MAIKFEPAGTLVYRTPAPDASPPRAPSESRVLTISAGHVNNGPDLEAPMPHLVNKGRMVGVRMNEDEIAKIDDARGSVSRQDFLRKAALWLADQAEKLR